MKHFIFFVVIQITLMSYPAFSQDSDVITDLTEKADNGDPESQYTLGNMYYAGFNVPKDQEKGIEYLKLSAENGHASGQASLGYMYLQGFRVQSDLKKALKWFRYSSAQKNPYGQTGLAKMYLSGQGVRKNHELAFRLFKDSAESGDYYAQYYLATLYATETGTRRNYDRAYQWLLVSHFMMRSTNRFASDYDEQLITDIKKLKDGMEKQMTPAHIRINKTAALRWLDNYTQQKLKDRR